MVLHYVKAEHINLRTNPDYTEKWVQDLITADPSILGLGDLVLRDKERRQPTSGRLDLLLQDVDSKRRYEIELQLGSTDEAHIIRTIEYWDIERKRYPQYEHCAVLIAEDITSRFLNVVSLFNGTVPLIAIQMQAVRIDSSIALVFTKVLDELSRGVVDEDEDAESAPANRDYWEKRGSKASLLMADTLLDVAKKYDPSVSLKYNKFYIGLLKNGQAYNFLTMRPRKTSIRLSLKIPRSEIIDDKIAKAGFDILEYEERYGQYNLSLTKEQMNSKSTVIEELIRTAHDSRSGS
jgi:hypothetical protein